MCVSQLTNEYSIPWPPSTCQISMPGTHLACSIYDLAIHLHILSKRDVFSHSGKREFPALASAQESCCQIYSKMPETSVYLPVSSLEPPLESIPLTQINPHSAGIIWAIVITSLNMCIATQSPASACSCSQQQYPNVSSFKHNLTAEMYILDSVDFIMFLKGILVVSQVLQNHSVKPKWISSNKPTWGVVFLTCPYSQCAWIDFLRYRRYHQILTQLSCPSLDLRYILPSGTFSLSFLPGYDDFRASSRRL